VLSLLQIGKLVQINRFQFEPVHEAHQIPEEPSSSQPEASK
jgi:hypothetical protein